ncbi:MAG TPA: hypothetical protein VIW03_00450 [Anaeromyxobacter sp.]
MRDVTIRSRSDGVLELAPRLAPAGGSDRLLLIATVLLASAGLFVSGVMPAAVLAAIAASCLAGEVVLGVKALALLLLRPAADVLDVERWRARRG